MAKRTRKSKPKPGRTGSSSNESKRPNPVRRTKRQKANRADMLGNQKVAKDHRLSLIRTLQAPSKNTTNSERKACKRLAQELKRCTDDTPCRSPACPECLWRHQLEMLKLIKAAKTKYAVPLTPVRIVPKDSKVSTSELTAATLHRMKERHGRQLRRIGKLKVAYFGFAFAYIQDADKEPYWRIYLEGFVLGEVEEVMDLLGPKFPNRGRTGSGVTIRDSMDLADLALFSFKSEFSHRTRTHKSGKTESASTSLQSEELRVLSIFLDHTKTFFSRAVMKGMTRSGKSYQLLK